MFLQTWTKTPFFVGPGEAWANDVMLDTAQIFFVDGSCNQPEGEFHQNIVFLFPIQANTILFRLN